MPEISESPLFRKLKRFIEFARPRVQALEEDVKLITRRQHADKRLDQVAVKRPTLNVSEVCYVLAMDQSKPRFDQLAHAAKVVTADEAQTRYERASPEVGLATQLALTTDFIGADAMLTHLKEFAALPPPEPTPAQAAAAVEPSRKPLPPKIEEQLGHVKGLWSMPSMLVKLQEMLSTPETPIEDVSAEIEKDPGLSGQVLKVVNSAYTGSKSHVNSIRRAVTMLGFRTTNRIVTMSAMISKLGQAKDEVKVDMKAYWGHSLQVGHLASLVSEATGQGVPEDHFAAGLLHDVGKLVEYQYLPVQITKIMAGVKNGAPFDVLENRVLGFSHAVLGACVCEHWKLAEGVTESVRRHLDTIDALEKEPPPREGLVVSAVCQIQKTMPAGKALDRWCALLGVKPDRLDAAAKEATTRAIASLREVFMQL